MVEVNDWRNPQLTEAVLVWTGYGESTMPRFDNRLVEQRFGANAAQWLTLIKALADDFYASNAKYSAPDLHEMGTMAMADFMKNHPDAPEDIAKALAWCYTFDYR